MGRRLRGGRAGRRPPDATVSKGGARLMSFPNRAASIAVLAILGGVAAQAGLFALGSWTLEDMHVYLAAAHRLRDGEALYSTTNPLAAFQYAPWFAAAWVPFTFLPETVVSVIW